MNIKLYEIKYSENFDKVLDSGFDVFDGVDVNVPTLREIPIFNKFCAQDAWVEKPYSGLFSPSFTRKTGLTSETVNEFILKNPGFDVYLFHPYSLELSLSRGFLDLAELEHPGITNELNRIWNHCFKQDLPYVSSFADKELCCHCNFFVGNHKFWSIYSRFIKEFSASLISTVDTPYNLSRTEDRFLPLSVFCFERALTHFLKMHTHISAKNYISLDFWRPIELFDGEQIFCEKLSQELSKADALHKTTAFKFAINAYYNYRRLILMALDF